MDSFYSQSYGVPQLFWKFDASGGGNHIIPPCPSGVSQDAIGAYSAIAQVAVAGGILLIYTARKLLPRAPQWCRAFAQEELWHKDARAAQWAVGTIILFLLSVAGLVLTLTSAIVSRLDVEHRLWKWLEVVPWAVCCLVASADRPRKTPKTLLVLFAANLVGGLVSLYETQINRQGVNILNVGGIALAVGSILVILSMPMRDPNLDRAGIATSYDPATSELRSPEDSLSLWQFMTVSWMSPLIKSGFGKRLDEKDVWLLPYDFQHERLHSLFKDLKGSIIKRLLVANGLDLIIITFLGILETVANLAIPVLLQRLLVAIKNGSSHKDEAIFYATSMLIVRLVACQSAVFALWFSRRAYERSRGEMITTVYAKTLTRKTQAFQPDEKDPVHVNGNDINGEEPKKGRLASFLSWLQFWKKAPKESVDMAKPPATMGKILNLMRADCYEVSQRFWEFPSIVTKPLQVILSLILVWRLLGWPCLLGVGWVVFVQVLNMGFVNRLIANERLRRTATDGRLQATSQFVEAIRHLRWYDWQSKWLAKIMDARNGELRLRVITQLWAICIVTVNASASALFPVFSFFAYTYFAGKSLPVEIAFPALQLFTLLEASLKELPQLITVLLNAFVAVERLETFMGEPDKEDAPSSEETTDIEFRDASFAWPRAHSLVLHDLNLKFSTGFSVVCGKVGSGKTALLQAMLGEIDQRTGNYSVPSEMFGYCAQSPWLQNMSIRENILFCAPYDPVRYKQVLDACALTPDLANFKHGDLSSIGENGIGLSGGQKARVALARAVYSQARILLLDDPIAPLDHNTATTIVQRLFAGPLVQGRTVILVTHRVDLCIHLADQVIEISEGRAHVLDADEISRHAYTSSSSQNGQAISQDDQLAAATEEQDDAAVPDKFIEDEHRASGGVVLRVYWTYIKAGMLSWWGVLVLILMASRLVTAFNSWFLKAWGEAYPRHEFEGARPNVTSSILVTRDLDSIGSGFFDGLPNPEQDVNLWLKWYAIIAMMLIAFALFTSASMLIIIYMSAKNLFIKVINKVSNATFRFYDVTPVGRLMNRLTSDIGMLDGGMIFPLQSVVVYSLTWIISLVIIALTTPLFFAFALAMTIGFVLIFRRFLPASQSLRRLEFVSLSPLMSNFGILLEGLATIRAFKAQPEFQHKNIVVVDAFQQMDHFYWSLQAWLMYRFDSLSAISTFILTLVALNQGLSSGLTAFVLTTAAQFVDATHALCKVYGQLQMDFVSVERVVELLDLEEEASGKVEPPCSWPSYNDDIVFDKVTLRYAPHLEPSLTDVSFTIPGGSTCAVLGRTGSGKSTLALALLATMRPDDDGGHISIGAVDLAHVNVHAWRQRISFVAQDPVLFPGTLRQNLDPLEEHGDDECTAVLRRVLGAEWSLASHVDAGGRNLSQGQRQLVGIGRAVLRRSPVVVLDEATASIDRATALAIQDVLRDELRSSTVITIAHRLEAVKDADFLVRLDSGRVVESVVAGGGLGDGEESS